ncbi:hypothetical protein [Halorussus halophilus]|uniref:hypothetical protein n=1 Tax=Halorussus halophilus TaxID=2650975 RepID=UPI001300CD40|nr:hypothetical protein [Halorussus halophilus]
MNWRRVERGAWSLLLGGFLAFLVGGLLAPNPNSFLPYAIGSLVLTLPVVYWLLGRSWDDDQTNPGQPTLFFVVIMLVGTAAFQATDLLVSRDTTVGTLVGAAAFGFAYLVARGVAYHGGYERLRDALG